MLRWSAALLSNFLRQDSGGEVAEWGGSKQLQWPCSGSECAFGDPAGDNEVGILSGSLLVWACVAAIWDGP